LKFYHLFMWVGSTMCVWVKYGRFCYKIISLSITILFLGNIILGQFLTYLDKSR